MTARASARTALVVFVLSAIIRIAWASFAHVTPVSDFRVYHNLAQRLLETSTLGSEDNRAYRTPGYPGFLAAIYLVFGQSWKAVGVIQAVFGAATSALVVLLAVRIVSIRAAGMAGVLHAAWPTALAYTPVLGTETIATPLMLLCLLSLARSAEGGPKRIPAFAIGAGVSFGLLLLIKPSALLFLPALVLLAAFYPLGRKLRPKSAAIFVIAASVVVAPWFVRNQRLGLGSLTLSTTGALLLWMGNNDMTTTGAYQKPPERFYKLTERERSKAFMSEALSWISHNPGRYLALCRTRLVHLVGTTIDPFAASFLTPSEHDDLVIYSRTLALQGHHTLSPQLQAASRKIFTRNRAFLEDVRVVWAPLMLLAVALGLYQWRRFGLVLFPAICYMTGVSMLLVIERYREAFEPLMMIPVAALLNCVLSGSSEYGPRVGRVAATTLCAAALLVSVFLHVTGFSQSWYSLEPLTESRAWAPAGAFQPLEFDGTPQDHASARWNRNAKRVKISGSNTTLRVDVTTGPGKSSAYGGVAFRVRPFKALRLDLEFTNLSGVRTVYVDGYDASGSRAMQWRWSLTEARFPRRRRETYVFVPNQACGHFKFEGFAGAGDVVEVHVFLQVLGDSIASFAVHDPFIVPVD